MRARPKIQSALNVMAVMLLLSTLLGGCEMISHQQSYMVTHGPVAARQYEIFMTTVYVTVAIFIVVTSMLLYAVFRYRDTTGEDKTLPSQTHGNPLIEGSLGVVSALLLVLIAVPTVNGIFYDDQVPADLAAKAQAIEPAATPTPAATPAASDSSSASPTDTPSPPTTIPAGPLKLTVTGHQWWWQFDMPDLTLTTADEFEVPVGHPVAVTLDSADVIHSFWIPQLAGKVDVIPGQENHMWFQGDDLGWMFGQCTEFCGTDHALMDFKCNVVSPEEFQKWVDLQKADALDAPATDADATAGETIIQNVCSACHTVRGAGAAGSIGPDLTHLMSRKKIIADYYENTPDNLTKWLKYAQVQGQPQDDRIMKRDTKMILPRALTDQEISQVVKYLETLK